MSTRSRLIEVITNLNEVYHLLSEVLDEADDLTRHKQHIEIIQDMANEVAELTLDDRFTAEDPENAEEEEDNE